jgi:uncharacterized membrane protein
MMETRHVSVAIARSPDEVYAFASEVTNLPRWASGLASGIRPAPDGDGWIVQAPEGELRMRFAAQNPWRVLDHSVVLPDGTEVLVPMRVLPNGKGSEVVITAYRRPGTDGVRFEADASWMARDLAALKALLEG